MRARTLLDLVHTRLSASRDATGVSAARRGLVGPALFAVTLAATGHQVSGTGAARPELTATASASADASAPGLAELVADARLAASLADRAPDVPRRSTTAAAARPSARPAPARAARSAVRRTPPKPVVRWSRPAVGPLTSHYGSRWGRQHKGIDIGAGYGARIRSVGAGVVVSAGYNGAYGRMVEVRHAGGVVTAYAHMSRIAVSRGKRVKAGEVIGYVGSSGRSTGPHLHFEVRVNGRAVNPLPWLRQRGIRY